jgi:two-component system, sensor histidine kinase and response regulator
LGGALVEAHRILIVDDDPIGRHVLEEALSQYEIRSAGTGSEALSLISSFRPDLVLLDVNLPEFSGYDVCRAIRDNKMSHLMKVVLVSANIILEERLRGYAAGADDYVTKPFNLEELQAKVDVFVKLKREEEVMEAKSNLLGLFTHETRTPLGVIIGFSDLLRNDVSKSEETRNCAQAIYKSGLDLHQFIEKATLLGRLKGGDRPERSQDLLHLHINRAINRNQLQIDEKRIQIHQRISSNMSLQVDWEMFDEVLNYMIENAVKFSDPEEAVILKADLRGSEYRIVIADHGQGISTSWIHNIFDEFAIKDINHHKHGQGLSLSISKQVVELHGGHIEVESEEGKGTSFAIFLPVDASTT